VVAALARGALIAARPAADPPADHVALPLADGEEAVSRLVDEFPGPAPADAPALAPEQPDRAQRHPVEGAAGLACGAHAGLPAGAGKVPIGVGDDLAHAGVAVGHVELEAFGVLGPISGFDRHADSPQGTTLWMMIARWRPGRNDPPGRRCDRADRASC